ncbi:MAG TPA: class I SAM-dependent methyltransferase [Caulobacteraceae bacterium]|nr:class I SAM-dependent methyltransferase [Caulobacteraceae bacterium]
MDAEADPKTRRSPAAFRADRNAHVAGTAVKAAWWAAAALAMRAIARPADAPAKFAPTAEPAPKGFFRRAWLEAFEKDAADVAAGLFPPMSEADAPGSAARRTLDMLADARDVEARRRRSGGVEVRDEAPSSFPPYYRQNFHFQSGGWFTKTSARRYESQVEALFAGAAGPMRRRALSLLAKAWRGADQRSLTLVDLACGSGAFLNNLAETFPRARIVGLDLSEPYAGEARRRSGLSTAVGNAERLPFADASLDGVSCVYLFHELPPKVRKTVAAEIARVLRPGGRLAFADSIQPADEPRLARSLETFPAYFHEPFFASYARTDLPALFAQVGLVLVDQDSAFLTKALLLEKVG